MGHRPASPGRPLTSVQSVGDGGERNGSLCISWGKGVSVGAGKENVNNQVNSSLSCVLITK